MFSVTRRYRSDVCDQLTDWLVALTWLMRPWWVMIPIEDLTDVTLAIEDSDEDDEDDEDVEDDEDDEDDEEDLTDVTLVSDDTYWRLDMMLL